MLRACSRSLLIKIIVRSSSVLFLHWTNTATMDQFNEATHLNSKGVRALLDGDEELAVSSCAASIKIMKSLLSTSVFKVESKDDDDCSSSSVLQLQSKIGECSRAVELPNVIVQGQLQDSILFNQAITIPDFGPQCPPPSEQDIHVCTAVVVFNLAIAHHRKGKKMGVAAYITKAEKLYSMILKLLGDDANNNTVIGVLVKLASINNLLEIRFESGNYDLAREGLGHVSNMLRCCAKPSQDVTDIPRFQEPDVKVLLMNILLLKPPTAAPAA